MTEQQGKFVVFDLGEFTRWLDVAACSRVIRLVQNHHTWKPGYGDFTHSNHFALLRGMEGAHIDRGFSEIAQNLTTFPDGTVALCRSFEKIPAGIKGANRDAICVEHLGNFDGVDTMTPEHRESVVAVNSLLCRRFDLTPDTNTIVYHHWYDLITGERTGGTGVTKTCPGTSFFSGNSVDDARQHLIPLVKERLDAYGPTLPLEPTRALYSAEVAVDALNVRSQPSASGSPLKQLRRGVEVRVYEERTGWCRIDPGQQWVDGHFLSIPLLPRRDAALYSARVTADVLNVRTLPALSGAVADQLVAGRTEYVYEERNGWCKIDPIRSLWVSGAFLSHPQ